MQGLAIASHHLALSLQSSSRQVLSTSKIDIYNTHVLIPLVIGIIMRTAPIHAILLLLVTPLLAAPIRFKLPSALANWRSLRSGSIG